MGRYGYDYSDISSIPTGCTRGCFPFFLQFSTNKGGCTGADKRCGSQQLGNYEDCWLGIFLLKRVKLMDGKIEGSFMHTTPLSASRSVNHPVKLPVKLYQAGIPWMGSIDHGYCAHGIFREYRRVRLCTVKQTTEISKGGEMCGPTDSTRECGSMCWWQQVIAVFNIPQGRG